MDLNRPIKDNILIKQLKKHVLGRIDSDLWKISVAYINDNFITKFKKLIKKLALNSLNKKLKIRQKSLIKYPVSGYVLTNHYPCQRRNKNSVCSSHTRCFTLRELNFVNLASFCQFRKN